MKPSCIGWIALAIGAAALVIYKYWKPITAFFKGMWKGLKEGLQPLMPLFKRMAAALEPIIKPIRAIIDWFKKLIKPVEDTGGATENMGVKFGKAIADIIVKFVELITKAFECGAKITSMLAEGICVPEDEIKNLVDVADKATPLKFIKGNGEYVGVFVIQEIGKTTEQASPEGDLISIQVDIRLREYTGKIPEDKEEEKGFRKR